MTDARSTPPSASDTSADGSPNVEWKRLIDMPNDTLAHRIVGSLILAKGNLVGYRAIIKRVLDDIAKEHEVARSESAWISVKDRLPTAADAGEDGGVLAFIPGIYREARARHFRDVRCWMETEDKIEVGFWLPLPRNP